jgi:hypothetical protein
MQHDGALVAQKVCDVGAQGFGFNAGNDASLTADDGDPPDLAGFESQSQKASGLIAYFATAFRTTVLRSSPLMVR